MQIQFICYFWDMFELCPGANRIQNTNRIKFECVAFVHNYDDKMTRYFFMVKWSINRWQLVHRLARPLSTQLAINKKGEDNIAKFSSGPSSIKLG